MRIIEPDEQVTIESDDDSFILAFTHLALVGVRDCVLAARELSGGETAESGAPSPRRLDTLVRQLQRVVVDAGMDPARLHLASTQEITHAHDLIRVVAAGESLDPMLFGHPEVAFVEITRERLSGVLAAMESALQCIDDSEFGTLVGLSKSEMRLVTGAVSTAFSR